MSTRPDPFGAHAVASFAGIPTRYARLAALEEQGLVDLARLPYSLRVLLENVLRHCGDGLVDRDDVLAVAQWRPQPDGGGREIAFMPSRVVLQDFTGVPCVVDLAAMRSAVARVGADPTIINPSVPVDLVIDHSVQVDCWGSDDAYDCNVALEMQRNAERYTLLRWAQKEFSNFRLVPPGTGIVHQVNLEYLASVVHRRAGVGPGGGGGATPNARGALGAAASESWAFPDTVIGTDSHTTMINGLGVLGWGVGGIEAEAVMLGQPYFMLVPEVVGVRLTGALAPGATATDLVLTVTQLLRGVGVVGRFVEFFGPGAARLTLPDRATIANMAPEYGATVGFFAVDPETLRYLALTARPTALVDTVREYCAAQGLLRVDGPEPEYTKVVEFDLGDVVPSVAGPRRPQDRVALPDVGQGFRHALPALAQAAGRADTDICAADVCFMGEPAESLERLEGEGGQPLPEHLVPPPRTEDVWVDTEGRQWATLRDGAVVIAAITSCTNTSNPSVMLGAGLIARNAVRRGLQVKPWVKTSLAPGSRVVTDYLQRAGLLPYLDALGFHVVGYGCATCIGNSGPLPQPIQAGILEGELVTAAVLSGNRNFEARIHPLVRANYLASPMLVVAFALAGTVDIDLAAEPVGTDESGVDVYLSDLWPADEEIAAAVAAGVGPDSFATQYASVSDGDETWRRLTVPTGHLYAWDPASTYAQDPPFFAGFGLEPAPVGDLRGVRVLGIFGDSVTTDHISPAGAIAPDGPAGRYLVAHGISPADFNTYGSRRGNHEVMMRGTFANLRIRNLMLEGKEGGWTRHVSSGEVLSIFDAAQRYQAEGTPLVVLAGKEYGSGSSRDWAAKGPALLGVKVVIAESYERIHRSNLVGMGILPLQFESGVNASTLGLTGDEQFDFVGLASPLEPGGRLDVRVRRADGSETTFAAVVRLDASVDVIYFRQGGIMPRVLRLMLETCGVGAGSAPTRVPKIQLLHTLGCDDDNTTQARAALDQALEHVGIDPSGAEVEDVLVETEEQSAALGLVGGPAIFVDGVDVDPGVRGMRAGGLGCRAYITAEGYSAAPPLEMILTALREAMEGDSAKPE